MRCKELLFSATYFALVVCFLSPIVSIAQNESEKQKELIIGEWFPIQTSRGGIGGGYTFDTNGKTILTMGAYVTFKYKLDGDTLILEFPDSPVIKQKIKIDNSGMTLSRNGEETKLTKVSGESNSGIIGEWTGEHRTGGKQTMHFTAYQDLFFIVEMRETEATYKIKKDSIDINGKESLHWFVNSDTLTIKGNDDKVPKKYIRLK